MHFFASNLCVNRIDFSHLPNIHPLKDLKTYSKICRIKYNDLKILKENFKVIVGRIAVEFLPKSKFLYNVIPAHIKHKYSNKLSKYSSIIPLPILQCNENNYNDYVTILRQYEKWIFEIYNKVGLILCNRDDSNNPPLLHYGNG